MASQGDQISMVRDEELDHQGWSDIKGWRDSHYIDLAGFFLKLGYAGQNKMEVGTGG